MSVTSHRAFSPPNLLLPLVGLIAFATFAAVYCIDPHVYLKLVSLWQSRPLPAPFIDNDTGAQIACWQHGIDVYAIDPCDPLGRLFDYSPLWLRLWFLPGSLRWTNLLGVSQAIILILSLSILPRSRRGTERVVMLLAILSPVMIFALERSNVDLFLFVLAAFGIVCLSGPLPTRIAGYGAFLLGALLKFYPLALLILILREKPRVFVVLCVIGFGILLAFVTEFHGELLRAFANTPRPFPFDNSFGADQLPYGLGLLLNKAWLSTFLFGTLALASGLAALCLTWSKDFQVSLDRLTPRETTCLLVGADLTCGCFFGASNAGYRAIYLLFVIPSLLAMARDASSARMASLMRAASWTTIMLMWIRIPLALSGPEHPDFWSGNTGLFIAAWMMRELLWWFLATLLLAVLLRALLPSPIFQSGRGSYPLQHRLSREQ